MRRHDGMGVAQHEAVAFQGCCRVWASMGSLTPPIRRRRPEKRSVPVESAIRTSVPQRLATCCNTCREGQSAAITGATGQLGRLAFAALKRRGVSPVALARDPAKAADLGTEVRAFDYAAPDA